MSCTPRCGIALLAAFVLPFALLDWAAAGANTAAERRRPDAVLDAGATFGAGRSPPAEVAASAGAGLTDVDWIEPYPLLNGGGFVAPPVPESPDPLVQFRWSGGVNQTQLQCYVLRPVTVDSGTSC